jgi:hypothetical protein
MVYGNFILGVLWREVAIELGCKFLMILKQEIFLKTKKILNFQIKTVS